MLFAKRSPQKLWCCSKYITLHLRTASLTFLNYLTTLTGRSSLIRCKCNYFILKWRLLPQTTVLQSAGVFLFLTLTEIRMCLTINSKQIWYHNMVKFWVIALTLILFAQRGCSPTFFPPPLFFAPEDAFRSILSWEECNKSHIVHCCLPLLENEMKDLKKRKKNFTIVWAGVWDKHGITKITF